MVSKQATPQKPAEKTPAEKELEQRKTIAMVIGGIGAYLAIRFIAKPLLNNVGISVEWWVYLIVIFIGIGYVTKIVTKDMANEAMALQKNKEKKWS